MYTLPKICLLILLAIILIIVLVLLAKRFVFIDQPEDVKQVTALNSNVYHSASVRTSQEIVMVRTSLDKWIKIAWANTIAEQVKRFYYLADAPVRKFLQSKGWLSANN
jgi:hypothetical protein